MMVAADADPNSVRQAVARSLDRKVCNTLNVLCLPLDAAPALVEAALAGIQEAAEARQTDARLHVTAKARECPIEPIRRGDHQQPTKKPRKWAEPNRPICSLLKFSVRPEMASSGPTPPVDSCKRMTDRNRAAKEMIRRMTGST